MAGILAIPRKWLWDTRSIHAGETDRNSLTDETKSLISSRANGPGSWTTGLSRKCGHLPETGSPYASLTSGTTGRITGIAPTAMRTGNSTVRGSWRRGLHPSTTFPFWLQIGNITGCSGVVPMTIQGHATLDISCTATTPDEVSAFHSV